MRYTITVLVTVVFVLSAVPALSHRGDGVKVEVISDTGGLLTLIPHKTTRSGGTHMIKRYLEAKRGENYSIVVRNTMSQRIGVVIAVDGRNIITGKKSLLKSKEMMYIIGPYGSARMDGWRTDNDTVHRFYFTDVKDSYSVRTFADTSAMGVIAIAIFREKERPELFYEQQSGKEKSAPAPGAAARGDMKKQESDTAGTGFGDKKYSPVVQVEFEPEGFPLETILIKYEWREVLCSKRLLSCRTEVRNRLWDDDTEYAPYPPGY